METVNKYMTDPRITRIRMGIKMVPTAHFSVFCMIKIYNIK